MDLHLIEFGCHIAWNQWLFFVFVTWRENTGNETGSCTKQRTLSLCEYVPILSMQIVMHNGKWGTMYIISPNFKTTAQIFTKFWHHTAQILYYQYRWCHHHILMLIAPLVAKNDITMFQGPRSTVSKFHWNQSNSYGDMLHDSSLRDCFLQWPQNTLLVHLQPCHLWMPQTQLQLSQLHLQNSYQINHWYHSWHHPLTGTPQSNMMIAGSFVNQWKVSSPFRIFQWRHQRIPL